MIEHRVEVLTSMRSHILIIEDDPHIRLGLEEALTVEGYEVSACADGVRAVREIRALAPHAVILDVMLPGKSGYDICREVRALGDRVPILMLTAKGQEIDKVVGLELGADDYLTKPFGLRELLARVHALLRRSAGERVGGGVVAIGEVSIGDAAVDFGAMRVERGGRVMDLTPKEGGVLAILVRERGDVVSRERLLADVWGVEFFGTTRTLDQVVVKLRQKIEHEPSRPVFLKTVHGMGYRLESDQFNDGSSGASAKRR